MQNVKDAAGKDRTILSIQLGLELTLPIYAHAHMHIMHIVCL